MTSCALHRRGVKQRCRFSRSPKYMRQPGAFWSCLYGYPATTSTICEGAYRW